MISNALIENYPQLPTTVLFSNGHVSYLISKSFTLHMKYIGPGASHAITHSYAVYSATKQVLLMNLH